MKRRILKGCGGDSAQNFIRASGEQGFGRLQNFDSADGARNFTSTYGGQNFTRDSDGRNFISAQGGLNFISEGRARNFSFINDFSFLNAARYVFWAAATADRTDKIANKAHDRNRILARVIKDKILIKAWIARGKIPLKTPRKIPCRRALRASKNPI